MLFLEFNSFIKFLEDNHIIATIIATIISTYVTNLSQSFTNDLLLPILNRDGDGDGKSDISKYEDYTLRIFNIDFRIGNFSIELLKFILITYLMYFLSKKVK